MKHIFIINPAAGKKDSRQRVYTMAEALKKKHNLDVECMLSPSRQVVRSPSSASMRTTFAVETRMMSCGSFL